MPAFRGGARASKPRDPNEQRRLALHGRAAAVTLHAATFESKALLEDLLELLPPEEPAVQALTELHHETGGVNLVTLAFEADARFTSMRERWP